MFHIITLTLEILHITLYNVDTPNYLLTDQKMHTFH